jgi:hypothetical protein
MTLQTRTSKPSALSLAPNPARRHWSTQIAKLASSVRNFSFNGVILIDENGENLAGHRNG